MAEVRRRTVLGAALAALGGVSAVVSGAVFRMIFDPNPAIALGLLERAKELRAGQPGTQLVDHYLRIGQARLEPVSQS